MKCKIFENTKNNEDGQAALLMVLIVMFLLLFVGLFLTDTVLKQIKATKNAEQFTQAYFLADTGTEKILYEIKSGTINLNDFNIGDDLFVGGDVNIAGLGYFNAVLIDDSPLTIKIKGVYKNTARAIEISW
jgi:hypothetical protein